MKTSSIVGAFVLGSAITLSLKMDVIAEEYLSENETLVAAIDTEAPTIVSVSEQVIEMPTKVSTIPEIVEAAAAEFDQDPVVMKQVAFCESSYRPEVVGDSGLAVGLFQFHPDTWREESRFLGYTGDLRTDPVAASRVAAYMWQHGLQHRWSCYRD